MRFVTRLRVPACGLDRDGRGYPHRQVFQGRGLSRAALLRQLVGVEFGYTEPHVGVSILGSIWISRAEQRWRG